MRLFHKSSVTGSSNIKVKDEKTGNEYTVGSHILSSADSLSREFLLTFLLLFIAIICIQFN